MIRHIIIIICLTPLLFISCNDRLKNSCVGNYVLDTRDSLLEDRCMKMILQDNNQFIFTNGCNILLGTWELEATSDFVLISFSNPVSKRTDAAAYGNGVIRFRNPHLFLNDERIKGLTFIRDK